MVRAEILKAALELPDDEREQLADEILSSLEEDPAEVEQAWADEIERRLDEADAGNVRSIPGSEVHANVQAAIDRVREREGLGNDFRAAIAHSLSRIHTKVRSAPQRRCLHAAHNASGR
jgi:putative addiction module component (TIGR02574 family)